MMMPWESEAGKKIWKNKTAFMTFIRGGLRRGLWNRHPHKIAVLNKKRYKIPNPNPKGKVKEVWGFDCEMCGNTFTIKEGQVDHITPAGQLNQISDIQGFVERLVCITEDDLRLVCKGCNNALALAEKSGISYEQAVAEKEAIAIQKKKGYDVAWLKERGIAPATNAKLRREQIVSKLTENEYD